MNKRRLLIIIGILMVGLGVIGIFTPVMPTVPFLLAAGWCFSRSSPRLNHWLINNKYLRYYQKNYRERFGIPRHVKIITLIALWLLLGAASFLYHELWYWILLWAIGSGLTINILLLKNRKPESDEAKNKPDEPQGPSGE